MTDSIAIIASRAINAWRLAGVQITQEEAERYAQHYLREITAQPADTTPAPVGPRTEAVPAPLTDREVRTFRWAYGKEPDLAFEVALFASHRYAPSGYQCIGNPCRCGLDQLIEGLQGRKRVTPPVALDPAEQRHADRLRDKEERP